MVGMVNDVTHTNQNRQKRLRCKFCSTARKACACVLLVVDLLAYSSMCICVPHPVYVFVYAGEDHHDSVQAVQHTAVCYRLLPEVPRQGQDRHHGGPNEPLMCCGGPQLRQYTIGGLWCAYRLHGCLVTPLLG